MNTTEPVLASFIGEALLGEQMEFRIFESDGDLYVRAFDPVDGGRGDSLFFERANLPYVVQAMEDYFDPQRRGERTSINVERGKDDFLVCTAMPTKADYAISLSNNRAATIDGLTYRSWGIFVDPMTALRIKDELKKLI